MQQFPSISNYKNFSNQHCIAFDKLDGSNVRFEWSREKGWHKYGTRRSMINDSHPVMGLAPSIFVNKYGESLEKIFKENEEYKKRDSFIAFGEFLGPNTFAGIHDPNDTKDIVLFDIWIYKVGMIGPNEFINNFGHLHIPEIIYEGKLTSDFAESVKRNDYNLKEGVICKWGKTGKWKKEINMCKIKTNAYIEKLNTVFSTGKYQDDTGNVHLISDDC